MTTSSLVVRHRRGSVLDEVLCAAVTEPEPPRRCIVDDQLYDREGRSWFVDVDWVSPDQVAALLRNGADWLVDWCGDRLEWADELDAGVLARDVVPKMISKAQAERLNRRRVVPTVFVPSLLRPDSGYGRVLLFSEGPPGERW